MRHAARRADPEAQSYALLAQRRKTINKETGTRLKGAGKKLFHENPATFTDRAETEVYLYSLLII